ncbi:MAG: arginase family protein, partial [Alistipes sp.]|nr:arginase family protein [Alistipes sp.]
MEPHNFDPNGVGIANGAYFGMPFTPDEAELVLVSAAWDVTVSYGAGAVYAPDAIIEASTQLDFYDSLFPNAWRRGIATAGVDYSLQELSQRLRTDAVRVIEHLENGGRTDDDYAVRKIRRVNEGCATLNANIEAQAAHWLDAGKTVGLVGGDHSTPYGLIRALGARHAQFGILHIDAHRDLREAY